MENERIQDWEKKKEVLKKEYPNLTDEDLAYNSDNEDELLEKLVKKMEKTKHEIRGWLRMMG